MSNSTSQVSLEESGCGHLDIIGWAGVGVTRWTGNFSGLVIDPKEIDRFTCFGSRAVPAWTLTNITGPFQHVGYQYSANMEGYICLFSSVAPTTFQHAAGAIPYG